MNIKENWIITLVGKNPLPSYYSILNYIRNNTKVLIIYTDEGEGETISSKAVSENIIKSIKNKNESIEFIAKSCHKSNFEKIRSLCQELFEDIVLKSDYENLGNNRIRIVLDYTGGTKAMATTFYNFFHDINTNNYDKIDIGASYVSSNKKEIYLSSLNPVKMQATYKIEDIIRRFEIVKEDIIKLHGYRLEQEDKNQVVIVSESDKNNEYTFNKVDLEDGNLRFYVNKSIKKIKKLVDEYFKISDSIEKIGGTEALLTFNVQDYFINDEFASFQEAKNKFFRQLNNVYEKELKDKVQLVFGNKKI